MELYALKMGLLMDTPLSLSTLITLRSAIWSFFIMGKSKSTLKKIGKQYTFLQRLRLCQVKDEEGELQVSQKDAGGLLTFTNRVPLDPLLDRIGTFAYAAANLTGRDLGEISVCKMVRCGCGGDGFPFYYDKN